MFTVGYFRGNDVSRVPRSSERVQRALCLSACFVVDVTHSSDWLNVFVCQGMAANQLLTAKDQTFEEGTENIWTLCPLLHLISQSHDWFSFKIEKIRTRAPQKEPRNLSHA